MTGVVTVADLLVRNAPVPVKIDAEDTGHGISVGSLLRREGRAPHALDRPLQPRAHQQDDAIDEEPATDRRALVRRGSIAAGALLAAGSVFGAALLTDVQPTAATNAPDPAAGGTYPGQGLLDPQGPLAPPTGTVQLSEAAVSNPLDAGTPAPTSWTNVAFPSAIAAVPTGTAAAAATGAADAGAGLGGGTGGGASSPSTAGANAGSAGGVTGGGSGAGGSHSTPPPSSTGGGSTSGGSSAKQGPVADVGDGLNKTADGVGDTVGGGVGDTVDGLGDTVSKTTDTLDSAVTGLTGGGEKSNGNKSSAKSSSRSSDSDDDSSSSSAPQDEESSSDGGSRGSSGGLLGAVGSLAGGLLG